MFEYRVAKPEERDAYIELANYAFGFDSETLLPKVYSPSLEMSSIHKVAVNENGKICAQVAVLPQQLTVCDQQLRAGFLGIVSVHPKFRGQGHMKALMNWWLEESPENYDMLVLYGQRQRYEYFGFTRGGMRRQYFIEKPNIRHHLKEVDPKGISFCPFFEVEGAASFAEEWNLQRKSYIDRDAQAMPLIFNSLNQKATAVLREGKLIGYFISDASGVEFSELALKTADIKPVLKAYFTQKQCDYISVYVPDYEVEMNIALEEFAERYLIDNDCMFHIFDFANVLEAYLKLKHSSLGLTFGTFSAVFDGQPVTATIDEKGVSVERVASPDAVHFDKMQAQSLLLTEYARFHHISAPADWFPLPIFWYIVDKF